MTVDDATIRLVAVWCLIGWVGGLAFALALWWRPISRARHDAKDLRLLRMQLEDSDRQLTAALAQTTRLAKMLAGLHDDRGRVA